MNAAAHTPGPWRTSKRDPRVICNSGGDKWVGKALVGGGRRGNSPRFLQDAQQAEANACLFAAAPELLAALKSMAEYLAPLADQELFPEEFHRLQVALAIIAKAEGRS